MSDSFYCYVNVEFDGHQTYKEMKGFFFLILFICRGIKLYETVARFYKLYIGRAQSMLVSEIPVYLTFSDIKVMFAP